jgi:hypothetical protein
VEESCPHAELIEWNAYYKIMNDEKEKAYKKAEEKAKAKSPRRR